MENRYKIIMSVVLLVGTGSVFAAEQNVTERSGNGSSDGRNSSSLGRRSVNFSPAASDQVPVVSSRPSSSLLPRMRDLLEGEEEIQPSASSFRRSTKVMIPIAVISPERHEATLFEPFPGGVGFGFGVKKRSTAPAFVRLAAIVAATSAATSETTTVVAPLAQSTSDHKSGAFHLLSLSKSQ